MLTAYCYDIIADALRIRKSALLRKAENAASTQMKNSIAAEITALDEVIERVEKVLSDTAEKKEKTKA